MVESDQARGSVERFDSMPLSDDVRHAALAPLEAVWAQFPSGDDDEPSAELTTAALGAAHQGVLDALMLIAEAIERLEVDGRPTHLDLLQGGRDRT